MNSNKEDNINFMVPSQKISSSDQTSQIDSTIHPKNQETISIQNSQIQNAPPIIVIKNEAPKITVAQENLTGETGNDISSEKQQNPFITIANNLQSLDEIMYQCNQSKARSSSISVDKSDVNQQNLKIVNDKDDIIQSSVMNSNYIIEEILDMQESVTCSEKLINAAGVNEDQQQVNENQNLQDSAKKGSDKVLLTQDVRNQLQINQGHTNRISTQFEDIKEEIQENQQGNLNLVKLQENRMATLKNRMNINIQAQGNKSGDIQIQGSSQKERGNYSSPINEIQSDNSSSSQKDQTNLYNCSKEIQNISQSQLFTQLLNQNQEEAEPIQKDEFTIMFQSNCPIKSPTFIKTKKKVDQQANKITSMETSNDKRLNSSNSTIKEESLIVESQAEISKNSQILKSGFTHSHTEQQLLDQPILEPKDIKSLVQVDQMQSNPEQANQGIQLSFIADIKSVRNFKVNAFRSRLNLSQHEGDNEEFRKKSSTIGPGDLLQMQEPVSIKDLQKNNSTSYNTVETPVVNKRNLQANKGRPQYSKSMRSNFQIDETNDEYKDNEYIASTRLDQSNNSSSNEIDTSLEKRASRRFQRGELRIKVNPVKAEEKEENWEVDELTSTDQQIQEEPIVTKAKQGSNKFEDIYCLSNGKPLGEGTSGCVYQCRKQNSEDETVYAVKVMRNVDEEMSKSIFQTFGIQYRLQHEYISRVYEVYYNEDNQTVHYVMDFIPFRALDSVIRDKKRTIKESEASSIIQKLLKAVMYMEQRGVCHRDLKPENILISEDLSQLKIIDFGISKSFVKSQRVHHITQYYKHKMYTPTGTPQYKAPEILLGAGYTQLVDMWAVGIIAYQLITKGKHPFKCDSQIEQDTRILKFQFNQTDEGWVNASANSKNFIKSLLRSNRMPAFEALKHPWIEQKKIEVPADDDNHSSTKQEKKPHSDSMTISVPALFQARLFNNFGISVTNSEQQQRSSFVKRTLQGEVYDDSIPLRACNTINSTNDLQNHAASGNTNAHISSYGNNQKVKNNDKSNPGEEDKDSQGASDNQSVLEQKASNPGKKKHAIQGFASTQDVVHVVMRQKLSESREKMMQFFLKANTIIKNLEEEQLQQQNPQNLKRTHSAEKQCDSPTSPEEVFSKTNINNSGNQGLQGFNIYRNSSISNPFKDINENSNMNIIPEGGQQINFNIPQQTVGSQSQNYSQSSSDESTRFMMKMNNSILGQQNIQNILNKGAQSSLRSVGKNTSINEGNNISQNNYSMNNAMIYSSSDFSNMKFSSLMSRKTSYNRSRGLTSRYTRRNSTQQTDCMEKSIIFTKEVIGELQKDPVIQETFEYQQTLFNSMNPLYLAQSNSLMEGINYEQYQNMTDSIIIKSSTANNIGLNSKRPTINFEQSNPSSGTNKQQQGNQNIQIGSNNNPKQNKTSIMCGQQDSQDIFSKAISKFMTEEDKKKQNEKWKLIQENMDQRSDSGILEKQNDSSDEGDSDSSNESDSDKDQDNDDNTFSIDVTNLLLQNPNPNIQVHQEQDNTSEDKDESVSNQQQESDDKSIKQKFQNENISSISSKRNGFTSSSNNTGSEECKEQDKKNSSHSSLSSQSLQKNNSQTQQGGIFQKPPYTNYMNSSKDNIINQTLLSIQNAQDGNHQPAAVLTTSQASSKENISSNHSISQKSENSSSKNKIQQNSSQEDKQQPSQQPNNSQILKDSVNSQQNLNQSYCSHGSNNSQGCLHCQGQQKMDTILEPQCPQDVNFSFPGSGREIKTATKAIQLSQSVQTDIFNRSQKNIESISLGDEKALKEKQPYDVSIMDSAGNNLSFIEMNHSNYVGGSINNQSEEQISYSFKKNPFVSMNVSQASSINANNISVSGSANSANTIRSIQLMTQNNNNQQQQSNNLANTNSEGGINLPQQSIKEKANSSKFKQSDNSSNSQFKRQQNKFDLDMSESQQYSPADNLLQNSVNVNQGINTSSEATPSKSNLLFNDDNIQNSQIVSQQYQLSSNSGNSENSRETNSNNRLQQLQSNPDMPEQQLINMSSSSISPNKKSLNQQQNIKESLKENKNVFEYQNQETDHDNTLSDNQKQYQQQNYITTNIHQMNKYLTTNYSTIIEESQEARSYLTSSIAQSQRMTSEFESTNLSIGQQLNRQNYTRSLTTMVQSNSEKNESSVHNHSGQNNPNSSSQILIHQTSLPLNFQSRELNTRSEIINAQQAGLSSEDFDSHDDLEQHQMTDQKVQSFDVTSSQKKFSSSPLKKRNAGFSKMNKQVYKQSPLSSNRKVSVSKQLDEVFGQMQNSSSFMKQDDDSDGNSNTPNEVSKSPMCFKSYPPLSENEKQISPQQNSCDIHSIFSTLNEQPPLLKHRTSSRLIEKSGGSIHSQLSRESIENNQEIYHESSQKTSLGAYERSQIEVIPEIKNDEGDIETSQHQDSSGSSEQNNQ